MTNCTLSGNRAIGGNADQPPFNGYLHIEPNGKGYGGGIFNLNGTIILSGCMLSSNISNPGYFPIPQEFGDTNPPVWAAGPNLSGLITGADGGSIYNLAFGNRIEDGIASTATVSLVNTVLTNSSTLPFLVLVVNTNDAYLVVSNTYILDDLVNDEVDGLQTNTATVIFSAGSPAVKHIDLAQARSICAATLSQAALLRAVTTAPDLNFQFDVVGVPGYNYVVQTSTNMIDWLCLQTNVCPFVFVDSESTNHPGRFYRALYQP
jgi:hypothetical protein